MTKSVEGCWVQVPETSGAKQRAKRQRRGEEIYEIIDAIRLGRCKRSTKEVKAVLAADISSTRHQRTALFEVELFDLMQETLLGPLFPGDRTMPGPLAIGRAALSQAVSLMLEYLDVETVDDMLDEIASELTSGA